MASDWSQLKRKLKKQGYDVDETGKHAKITHPDHPGLMYFAPKTGSDHRGIKNTVGGLKKMFGYDKRR